MGIVSLLKIGSIAVAGCTPVGLATKLAIAIGTQIIGRQIAKKIVK